MKQINNIIHAAWLAALVGCSSGRQAETVSATDIQEINQEISDEKFDSISGSDLAVWNAEYSKFRFTEQAGHSDFTAVEDLTEFRQLLVREKELLNIWTEIEEFPEQPYDRDSVNKDLIRRCSALDRAPRSAHRTPAYRTLSSVSATYYQIEVPVAFHIITRNDGAGELPNMQQLIDTQIDSLNRAYQSFHIQFTLKSVETTANNRWFNSASYYDSEAALIEMTNALSVDPGNTMNVFSVGSRVLGEATYPWYRENGTRQDYVLINFQTLPGGPASFESNKYSEGNTLVHEVGHYLGLLHTFEGGNDDCQGQQNEGCKIGDQVDDTPSQKICYFDGCGDCDGSACNSCADPEPDQVRNYMGYNPDACMHHFTRGQGSRMQRAVLRYRPYFIANLP